MSDYDYGRYTTLGKAQALRPALADLICSLDILGIDTEALKAAYSEVDGLTSEGSSLLYDGALADD